MTDPSNPEIDYGRCHCGCGMKTKIAQRNSIHKRWVKGYPKKYVLGHWRSARKASRILWIDGAKCHTIPLTQDMEAVVDDADFKRLSEYNWSVYSKKGKFYAHAYIKGKIVQMHRLIIDAPNGIGVDHWSGNGLDNRRCNIRLGGQSQNGANQIKQKRNTSSKYKGVSQSGNTTKWSAYIKVVGVKRHLGLFTDEANAARVYDKAARLYFKEFAALNFPRSGERSALTGEIV